MSAPHNSTYTSTVEESLHNSTFEVRETSPLRPSVWALPIAPSRWRARTERRERTGGGARRAEVAGVAEVVEARRSAPRPSPCHPASPPPPPRVEEATDRTMVGGGGPGARQRHGAQGRRRRPEPGRGAEGRGGAAGPSEAAAQRGGAAPRARSTATTRRTGAAPPARARPRRGGQGRHRRPERGRVTEGTGTRPARRAAAARAELVAGANARGAELGRGRRAQITWGRGQSSPLPWAEWGREGWLSL